MRIPRLLLPLVACLALAPIPAVFAQAASGGEWPQFQADADRSGFADPAPSPPYALAWQTPAGLGDLSHLAGLPAPIVAGGLGIVVGREDVTAVRIDDGAVAWTVRRALGPSSPAAVDADDGLVLFLEGGGDESASASASPSPTPTPSPTSATQVESSTLVAVALEGARRRWTYPIPDVSRTGVLLSDRTVFVGADDGTIAAIDVATGEERWSVDVGGSIEQSLASADDLVLASVQPDEAGPSELVALRIIDGSQAWRYRPPGLATDLGAPSSSEDLAYVSGSTDATVRAISLADGGERWSSRLYAPATATPPALGAGGVAVADQTGTVYRLDPDTGAEQWRFATNRGSLTGPVWLSGAILLPTADGALVALDPASGHQIWHGATGGSLALAVAASRDAIVVSQTGDAPGLVAFEPDAGGPREDLPSPTDGNPAGLVLAWLAAALPISAVLIATGRAMSRRMGLPELGVEEGIVDPWETDLEDEP